MSINLKKIIKNFFSVSMMRLATAMLSFVLFTILARNWGAEMLGEFSTLFTYFMFILQLPLLGLHIVLARRVATEPDTISLQFTNALAIAMPVSLGLMLLIGGIGLNLYPESMHNAFWLVGLSSLPMAFAVAAEAVLTGKENMHVIAWVNIIETVLRVVICLILVWMGYGVTALFLAFLGAKLLAVFIYWFRGGLKDEFEINFFNLTEIIAYLRQSPMFFGILILSVGIGRFDFIFLSLLASMQDVGMYSPPFKIYEMGLMVPSVLTLVLFPVFSRMFTDSQKNFEQLYQTMFQVTFIFGLPLVLILALSADWIVPLIFGSGYVAGSGVLQILAFAILFIAMDQVLTVVVLAAHRESLELKILCVSFAVYLIMLLVLIHFMSFYGAALATLLTTLFKFILRYVWLYREMSLPSVLGVLFKPLIAGGLMLGCVVLLKPISGLFIALFCSFIFYWLILFLTKAVSAKQLQSLKQLMVR
ncbi:oligosaccharide flippase family protein [Methylophaga nitratireducenticrescens]|uniref:Polysaccharide biosynthesis protein n=1 Tax=Methylophaga nitratireducenticrescens TaxID=754476 RepID=I1XIP2_METNJ|nr:oligosaccharide flippase family protein [Methylophaga nitratireducenticrescens]AFI84261.1 hypothetical protein Q7A_1431 [Methylophaga nitratireducenticrescens]AUZ84339.1 hypothetical protein CDW43_06980 [Methylophaga nitratireducenticrescens]